MKICAVVAEFNPFHNGHAYLLEKIRSSGYSHIVVVMSGNYVQRGEAAIFPKDARAKAALQMGANLVIELPTVKVLATAEKYAFSALSVIKKLGNQINALAFGTETENFENLVEIKEILGTELFKKEVKLQLEKGLSFAVCRENAVRNISKKPCIANEIKNPNNILAVEYLKAMDKLGMSLDCLPVKRMEVPGKYFSASKLRERIIQENLDFKNYIPENLDFNTNLKASYFEMGREIICKLRSLEKSDFARLPDVSEGLENRIRSAVKKACSLPELLEFVKTKRYAMARIKRIILCAFLGIDSNMASAEIPYVRVLGSDKKGFEILKNVDSPVVTRYSDVLKLGSDAQNFFELENKFTNIYYSLTKEILPCEKEKTFKMIRND